MTSDFCFYCSYLLFQILLLLNSPTVHVKRDKFYNFYNSHILSATFFIYDSFSVATHKKGRHANT